MNLSFFIFFIPLTIVFLLISLAAIMYFLMGLYMLRTGIKENSSSKTSGGSISVLLSGGIMVAASWFYIEHVWLW
jgi:hypothetical protein